MDAPLPSVHFVLAYILYIVITYLETSVNNFESLCVNDDSCVAIVPNFCFVFRVLHHSANCALVRENVSSFL